MTTIGIARVNSPSIGRRLSTGYTPAFVADRNVFSLVPNELGGDASSKPRLTHRYVL
jgi:hypothetical protein